MKTKTYIEHLQEQNVRLVLKNGELRKEIERLDGENRYLLQRLKDFRHKSWFPVFKENLELQEANKNLDETCKEVIAEYEKLEKEFKQYKAVVQSVETFIRRFSDEKR
jgi:FtsZ-binding cell division protein ZapB